MKYILDSSPVRCMHFGRRGTVGDITRNEASSRSSQLPVRIKHRVKNLGIRKTWEIRLIETGDLAWLDILDVKSILDENECAPS